MPEPLEPTFYCPRCDKPKKNLEECKKHVAEQHPDHDPEWWDTHPHEQGSE